MAMSLVPIGDGGGWLAPAGGWGIEPAPVIASRPAGTLSGAGTEVQTLDAPDYKRGSAENPYTLEPLTAEVRQDGRPTPEEGAAQAAARAKVLGGPFLLLLGAVSWALLKA